MPEQHDPPPVAVRIVGPPLTGAQKRKRAGLATAGTGFLLADRAKSIAPGAADWTTRSAKKIGEAEHKARVEHRTALIGRHGARTGAALAAAGLLLASQGALSEAKDKAKAKLKERQGKGAEMVDVPTSHSLLPSPFGKRETIMDGTAGSAFFAKADDRRQAGNYAALGAGGGTAGAVLAGAGIKERRDAVAGSRRIREKVQQGQHTAEDIAHSNELHGLYRLGTKARNIGLIGGGAALAAGTAGAIHYGRRARAKAQVDDSLVKSAFFAKADHTHPEETNPGVLRIRAGQATADQKRSQGKAGGWASLGTTGALAGGTVAAAAHEVRGDVRHSVNRLDSDVGFRRALTGEGATASEKVRAAQLGREYRLMGRVRTGGLIGGGASLAVGVPLAIHHARKANKQGRAATDLRLRAARSEYGEQPSPVFAKAYDPEARRHSRQGLYSGTAIGGSVLAAGGAGVLGNRAHKTTVRAEAHETAAARHDAKGREQLRRMAKPEGRSPKDPEALDRSTANLNEASRRFAATRRMEGGAKILRRSAGKLRAGSIGAGIGSAALAGTALGIQHYDRFGGGRSYGYY